MDIKSKNISFYGNQLSNIDRDINTINESKNLMCRIVFYNGSGDKKEIAVWKDLSEELNAFLIDFNNRQKEIIYKKIDKELKQ
jgi:hypothetical protein